MTIILLLSALLFGQCLAETAETAKGLVYYPPYTDPYSDWNPCHQLYEWEVQEGTFTAPRQKNKQCKGYVNSIPFISPKAVANRNQEVVEDFAVDVTSYNTTNYNIQFTCKDQAGRVKSGLYYWFYLYRPIGAIKPYSYQTTMAWDTEGKMLFQPFENHEANISCRYYDSAKGYVTAVRTWRLTFVNTTQAAKLPASVEVFPCSGPLRPMLSTKLDVNVVVTSTRIDFPAFCPVVSCQPNDTLSEFLSISYTLNSKCTVSPFDPTSYPKCVVNPVETKNINYTCSAVGTEQSTVKINVQSGARFTNEEDFRPVFIQEGDSDFPLFCYVNPKTAPDSIPIWEFMPADGGQYQVLNSSDYEQINDNSTGKHLMIIKVAKLEHEGSYRCQVPQSSRIIKGGMPIYGYYFVKVYPKPLCTPYDGATGQSLNITNGTLNIDLRLMSDNYLTIQCSGTVITKCLNSYDVCEPIAVLRKDGHVCSTSSANVNFCGETQHVSIRPTWPDQVRIDVKLSRNDHDISNDEKHMRGSYLIQLVYPAPANLHQGVITINSAPPPMPTAGFLRRGASRSGNAFWWLCWIWGCPA